jgi:chemosensory pili system protein ChpA (sensor histidine kinase/response regulator)
MSTTATRRRTAAKAAPADVADQQDQSAPQQDTPASEAVVDASASSAIVPADAEVTALSRWDALAVDIAIASQNAEGRTFDYDDKWGNKEARSHVAGLRRLKGRIERARKDAKAVHLERGRAVDATAKTLEEAVQGLIEPHELALLRIAAVEEARIACHRAVLDRIAALGDLSTIATAAEAEARLAELATIDSFELEEFATAGANRLADAIDGMEAHIQALRQREAEQAELEALRAEKAAREEQERQEAIRQQAIADERARAEQERIAEQQRIEQERIAAEAAAARREADAAAAAEATRQAQEAAERRAAEAERQLAEAQAREAARLQAEAEAQAEAARQAEAAQLAEQQQQALIAADREARVGAFRDQLAWSVAGMSATDVIDALIDGTLHPAITISWERV